MSLRFGKEEKKRWKPLRDRAAARPSTRVVGNMKERVARPRAGENPEKKK